MANAPGVGSTAPDFELHDTDDNQVRLSQYRGRHVHLVFNRGFS
jgi:peroxiredoxin